MPLIEVKDLYVHFEKKVGLFNWSKTGKVIVHAVDGVSFTINQGETFGLVGESGCGKSTMSKALLRLLPKSVVRGQVRISGNDLYLLPSRELRQFRKNAQLIFQDVYSSLSPRMTLGEIIAEPFQIHHPEMDKASIEQKVEGLLSLVALSKRDKYKYPAEISGGQGRRVGIARALALQPNFLVCDELTSGLDISISAEIINLVKRLQKEFNLTLFMISHNLGVVLYASNTVAVMYLGKIVEIGETREIFRNRRHRYTQALFSAALTVGSKGKSKKIILEGEIPSPINVPTGCRFHKRCWDCQSICEREEPVLSKIANNHWVACHLAIR